MNSVAVAVSATATFLGANFMLFPRWIFGSGDGGAASVIGLVVLPLMLALLLSLRFAPHALGPDRTLEEGSALYCGGERLGLRSTGGAQHTAGGGDAGRQGKIVHKPRKTNIPPFYFSDNETIEWRDAPINYVQKQY